MATGLLLVVISVGALTIFVGDILCTVGLTTNYWATMTISEDEGGASLKVIAGLYQMCIEKVCVYLDDIWEDPYDDLKTTRGLIISGLVFGYLAGLVAVVGILQALIGKIQAGGIAAGVCAGLSFLSFILTISGVIVYRTTVYDDFFSDFDLDYSFTLCIVGACLLPIGVGLVLIPFIFQINQS